MSQTDYTQCVLRRAGTETVAWIPTTFAVKGKPLKLKKGKRGWQDGWMVHSIGETASSEDVMEREREYRVGLPSIRRKK